MNGHGTYSPRELTSQLKKVAMESGTITDDGEVMSNAEHLARILWKKALGYTETRIKSGQAVDKIHDPAAWAIQLIIDRLEGKAAAIAPEAEQGITATDRIEELAVDTVNRLTSQMVGCTPPPPLPKIDGDS